jgi:hypothetical protein
MLKKIIKIEELDENEMIDIEVSGDHLFYANDILTHNSSSDLELTDTSESFGLPATADLMIALISTEELENMGQVIVKQLKNRYSDPTVNKRFILGIDRSKMRLYDCEQTAQKNLQDSGQEFDDEDKKPKKSFDGFKF